VGLLGMILKGVLGRELLAAKLLPRSEPPACVLVAVFGGSIVQTEAVQQCTQVVCGLLHLKALDGGLRSYETFVRIVLLMPCCDYVDCVDIVDDNIDIPRGCALNIYDATKAGVASGPRQHIARRASLSQPVV